MSCEKAVVYVSGPMRGQPNDNFEVFDAVGEVLIDLGYEVRNPASKGHLTETYTWQDAMKTDIGWVMESECICLLPGWEQSEGARLEVSIARTLGLRFLEAKQVDADGPWWSIDLIDTPEHASVEGIDAQARRLVYGARAQTYGHPRGDFDIIGKIWGAILGVEVSAEQVAIMMSGLKLARLAKSPDHRDSQVDTIGYMLCLARIQEDPAELNAWEARAPDTIIKFENKVDPEKVARALRFAARRSG